jgi:hypothetical protein
MKDERRRIITMGRVHLIQYLCPERHCLATAAYRQGDGGTYEAAVAGLRAMLKSAGTDPWCDICGSHDLAFEDLVIPFDTWEAALPELRRQQAETLRSRSLFFFDTLGLIHDRRHPGDPPRV